LLLDKGTLPGAVHVLAVSLRLSFRVRHNNAEQNLELVECVVVVAVIVDDGREQLPKVSLRLVGHGGEPSPIVSVRSQSANSLTEQTIA
jgi:hypothetical protein